MATTTMSKAEMKEEAQDLIMDAIGNVLGYWEEMLASKNQTIDDPEAFRETLQKQADRIAKMFGYDAAWGN